MTSKAFAALVFLLALLPPTASAEYSIEAYLGKAYPLTADLTLRQGAENTSLTFSSVEFEDESFESPVYWGLRLGYLPKEEGSLKLEIEFIHYKVYTDPNQLVDIKGTYRDERYEGTAPLGELIQEFSISHGTNLLLGNVSGSKGLFNTWHSTRPVKFTGRFGVGVMLLHAETEVQGAKKSGYQFGGFAYQGDVGLEIPLWRNLALVSAYKLSQGGASIDVDRGTIDLNLTAQHLTFGLGVVF